MSEELEKRTWYYVGKPCHDYDIAPCKCGNQDVVYSEYVDRLWCAKCEIDFEPEHWGVFSGAIPWEAAAIIGYTFDRINLETDKYERCVKTEGGIDYVPVD